MKLPGWKERSGTSMREAYSTPARMGPIKPMVPGVRNLTTTRSIAGEMALGNAKARQFAIIAHGIGDAISTYERIDTAKQNMSERAASAEYNNRMALFIADAKKDGNELDEDGRPQYESLDKRVEDEGVRLKTELREKYRFDRDSAEMNWKMRTDTYDASYRLNIKEYKGKKDIEIASGNYYVALQDDALTPAGAEDLIDQAVADTLITPLQGVKDLEAFNANLLYKGLMKEAQAADKERLIEIQEHLVNGTAGTDDLSVTAKNAVSAMISRSITNDLITGVNQEFDQLGEVGAQKHIDAMRAAGPAATGTYDEVDHQAQIAKMTTMLNARVSAYDRVYGQSSVAVNNESINKHMQNPTPQAASMLASGEGAKAWKEFDETRNTELAQSEDFWDVAAANLISTSKLDKESKPFKARINSALRSSDPKEVLNAFGMIRFFDSSPEYRHVVSTFDDASVKENRYVGSRLESRGYEPTAENINAIRKEYQAIQGMDADKKSTEYKVADGEWALNSGDDPSEYFKSMIVDSGDMEDASDVTIDSAWITRYKDEYRQMRLFYGPKEAERMAYVNLRGQMGFTNRFGDVVTEKNSPEIVLSSGVLNQSQFRGFIEDQTGEALNTHNAEAGTEYTPDDVQRLYVGFKDGQHTWLLKDQNGDFLTSPDGKHRVEITYEPYVMTETPGERQVRRDNDMFWNDTTMAQMSDRFKNVELADTGLPRIPPGGVTGTATEKAEVLGAEWDRMSENQRDTATKAYNLMYMTFESKLNKPENYVKELKWYLFGLGYLKRGKEGEWEKPPGWEFQVAD